MPKLPTPPRGLTPESRRFWREVVGRWELHEGELELLRGACRLLDLHHRAMREIADAKTLTPKSATGLPHAHPAVRVATAAMAEARQCLRAIGLKVEDGSVRPIRVHSRWNRRTA